MSGAQSRLAAADLLQICLEEHRTLDDAMGNSAVYKALRGPDRGFARAMTSATLRQLGRIDIGLAPFLDRPLETSPPPVRALLRIGAAQAWLMETAEHAVVSETVAAAKSFPRTAKSAGFLNAVLRKAVADRSAFDAAPAQAIWPDWLWQKVSGELGVAATNTLLEAQAEIPDLHLTIRDRSQVGIYADLLNGKVINGTSVQIEASEVGSLPGYDSGDWWVQDAAAALPAQLLGAVSGDRVFDLCAAPGGKTMQLASLGAKVTAVDRSAKRLRRLRENLNRVSSKNAVEIVEADLAQWTPAKPSDRILLDAPCSALGTLRRHPEGAWIKSQADIERFPALQSRLLRAALGMLKPGGTLIYCVCSPLPSEGLAIVEGVIADGLAARLPLLSGECLDFSPCLTPEGDLLTLPRNTFAHDAFFISRLTRPDSATKTG